MRIEYNSKALCYNVYCETIEEYKKMDTLLTKPLTAEAVPKSIEDMFYADTDRINTMKTKLNSLYGRMAMINKEYIVVHRAKKPIIIIRKSILAVEQDNDKTAIIYCSENVVFYVDEKYADVIKQLI